MNERIIAAQVAAMSRFDHLRQRASGRSADEVGDDRGAITTETAVVTALLVGAATLVILAIQGVAQGWVDQIPTEPTTGG